MSFDRSHFDLYIAKKGSKIRYKFRHKKAGAPTPAALVTNHTHTKE